MTNRNLSPCAGKGKGKCKGRKGGEKPKPPKRESYKHSCMVHDACKPVACSHSRVLTCMSHHEHSPCAGKAKGKRKGKGKGKGKSISPKKLPTGGEFMLSAWNIKLYAMAGAVVYFDSPTVVHHSEPSQQDDSKHVPRMACALFVSEKVRIRSEPQASCNEAS